MQSYTYRITLEGQFVFFRAFALPQDDEVMRPGQLCHQWRHNWFFSISLIELLHSKQVAAGEAA